jgi:hypothetical protein
VIARVLVAVAAATALAHASPRASVPKHPILVLESHTGDRPAYVDRLISSLDVELEKRGFAARPATILELAEGRVPNSGILDAGQSAAAVEAVVAEGARAYADGRLDDAARTLADAVRTIRRNPALFAQSARNSDVTFRALATLAIVQERNGDAAASLATMRELIRSFPARPLSRADYGPDGERLYRDASRQVQALGRGHLSIDAHDPRAVIFVDGQIQGTGRAALADLVPGTYRVLVQIPATIGRQYAVEVSPSDDVRLDVDPADVWLQATDRWIGFSFPTDADRGGEAKLAGQIARRWTGRDVVAVVGSTKIQDKPALIGSLYQVDGTALRSAVVVAEVTDRRAVAALAQFLADGTIADGIQVVQGSAGSGGTLAVARPRRIARPALFWTGVGAIAAAAASGAIALKFAGDASAAGRELQATCAVSCTSDQERALAAKQDAANRSTLIAGVSGGVALAASAVLIVASLRRHPARVARAALVPLRGGAVASLSFEF